MKLIKMNELMSVIESFDETQKAKLELYKKESMRIVMTRDKEELKKETDEKFKEFLKKEIEYFEFCIKEEK